MSNDDADVDDCRMKWQAVAAVLLVIIVASESFLIPEKIDTAEDKAKYQAHSRKYLKAMMKVSTLSATAKPRISYVCYQYFSLSGCLNRECLNSSCHYSFHYSFTHSTPCLKKRPTFGLL